MSFAWPLTLALAALQDPVPAEKTEKVEQVVEVTSTRLETTTKETGNAATIVGGERIREERPDSVVELLRGLPGFHITRTGSGRNSVNSMFTRGTNSNHTLVLVDGFQVTRDGGRFFEYDQMALDNLGRVEAVRGPASAVYGSDAIGGVINLISRRGSGPATARFSVEGGTFTTSRAVAELFGGDERIGYSMSLSRFEQADGQFDHSDFTNLSFGARVDYKLGERTSVALVTRYWSGFQETPFNGSGTVSPPEQEATREDDFLLLGVEFTQWIGDVVEAKLRISRNDTQQFSQDNVDAVDTSTFTTSTNFDRNLAQLTLNAYAGSWAVFTAGAEYETEELEETSFFDIPLVFSQTTITDEDRSNKALFAQAALKFGGRLFLTPGFRIEDNQVFGTDSNARIAAAWFQPETQTKLRGSWGTGITEPRLDQNFGVLGNPDLEPEQSVGWDAGIDQWLFEDRVRISATYFENRLRDLILYESTAVPPFGQYINGGDGVTRGIEAEAEARLCKSFVAGASYTFLRTRATDVDAPVDSAPTLIEGERFLRRPTHSGRAYVGIRYEDLAALFLEVNYVGNREDSSFTPFPGVREKNDDFWKTDLALRVRLAEGLHFIGRVDNLLDVSYEEILGYPGTHASFLAGLEYQIKL
jgi:vitamin B12 transporter